MCFRTSRFCVHAPWPVSGNSHCQLWTHHARQLLAEVRHIQAKPIQRPQTDRVCVCFLGILRLCSWRSKDVSSVFEVTPATTLKMESFSVLSVNVWATLWSLSYHTQRHLTTGTYLSLTWGLTEAHVIKPNDASLTVSFILTKCQSSQFGGVAESDQSTDSSTSFFPQDFVWWSVPVIFFSF